MKPALTPAPSATRTALALAGLTIAALLAYANSFRVPLLLDDWITIQENPQLRNGGGSLAAILSPPEHTGLGGRPVANLSFVLNHAISSDSVRGYHVVNFLIHLAAGFVLFGIVRRTLRQSGRSAVHAAHADGLALASAAWWLLHPLATQSVTYISQRTESLMGLFYLATLYCFARSVSAARAGWWQISSVVCCALGMATKEGMVTAPMAVALYDVIFVSSSGRATWRQRRGVHLALAATWLLLPLLMSGLGSRGVGFGQPVNLWNYLLIEGGAIVRYLWLCVWPANLVFDYGFDVAPHGLLAVVPLLFIAVLAVVAAVGVVRRAAWGFLAAWFLLLLAPTSSLVPIPLAPISENRAYLASAAVVVGTVMLVATCRSAAWRWWTVAATAAFAALTYARNADYRSELAIWTDTVAKNPTSSRAHNNLGRALQQLGRVTEARAEYEAALRINPGNSDAHANLASALGVLGDHAGAAAHARDAVRLNPTSPQGHYNLGVALTKLGQTTAAVTEIDEAIRLRPAFVAAHAWRATLFLQSNRPADAVRAAETALAIKPNDSGARYLLGTALLQLGRLPEAAATFEALVRAEPNNVDAVYAWGTTLLQAARIPEAIAQFTATLRLKPDHAAAHSNLGLALWQAGKLPEAAAEFEAALRIDPAAPAARENLQRLRAQLR